MAGRRFTLTALDPGPESTEGDDAEKTFWGAVVVDSGVAFLTGDRVRASFFVKEVEVNPEAVEVEEDEAS